MTDNFRRFFEAVQQIADACGMEAHAVVGVCRGQQHGQVTVASHAMTKLESEDETFTERYCDAMHDSMDVAIDRLAGAEDGDKIEYMN